jgi:hypothetical protein
MSGLATTPPLNGASATIHPDRRENYRLAEVA